MDTGFNTPACEAALREALVRLAYVPERLNIINTHLHMDHTGLNHRFIGDRRRIYISETDRARMLDYMKRDGFKRGERDRREGASETDFLQMLLRGPEQDSARRPAFREDAYVGLTDGQELDVGPCVLRMISTP